MGRRLQLFKVALRERSDQYDVPDSPFQRRCALVGVEVDVSGWRGPGWLGLVREGRLAIVSGSVCGR